MIKLTNIQMPLDYTDVMIKDKVCQVLKLEDELITNITLLKRATITENKDTIHYKMTVGVSLHNSEEESRISFIRRSKGASYIQDYRYNVIPANRNSRPVVVGFGPAGIFAALILAESGQSPIVLERGKPVDIRFSDINAFASGGELDTQSNIQFGEGGAGAFSDGKLKPGLVDNKKYKVMSEFVKAGADEKILYLEKPHVGSDVLRKVVRNLREKIISLGGEVRFSSKFTRVITRGNKVYGVEYVSDGQVYEIPCDSVILAIGHSARDTFDNLYNQGITMEQKPFGIGLRVEHPQEYMNKLQYGGEYDNPLLGPADYRLVTHLDNGRSVYSFCMCPGGYVVPAASEQGGICTNGMSEEARDGKNANSALLVSVTPCDFPDKHPLSGIALQRSIERAAFDISGDFCAPVQRMEDFINGKNTTAFGDVSPTYKPGTIFAPHSSYMPDYIVSSLKSAIKDFDEWMNGFYYPDALLTGPETRTTSPVRILRGDNLESADIEGLYPCGEGAGYAGGIISSAYDGLICAEKILGK
ncbi:MAG: hypothetical protein PHE51_03630 [Eubacteriales bacterium]|nr:hypothetical protein [Eubacteriales bacterium]